MSRKVKILEQSRAFDGFFQIDAYRLRQEAEGKVMEMTRLNFERGHAAAILLYDVALDTVLAIEEFRIGCLAAGMEGEACFNLGPIAGMIDDGEDPLDCALREAEEEAGVHVLPDAVLTKREIFPSPGGSSERVTLFLAKADLSDVVPSVHGVDGEAEQTWVKLVTRSDLMDIVHTQPVSGHLSNLALDLENLVLRCQIGDPQAIKLLEGSDRVDATPEI